MIGNVVMRERKLLRDLAFRATFPPVRRWLRSRWERETDIPPVGLVRFGNLRRLDPISRDWGDDRVSQIDILEYREGEHPRGTFVGDLTDAPHLPSDAFDCVILTQTLQLIYDLSAAIGTVHRILKSGGVVLVTLPGITPVNRQDSESWGNHWCWSFTSLSARRLFEEHFSPAAIEVETFGNVLAAASFLFGLGRDELTHRELDHRDPDYEMLITLRARKGGAPA